MAGFEKYLFHSCSGRFYGLKALKHYYFSIGLFAGVKIPLLP
jgi:hypothetical protein